MFTAHVIGKFHDWFKGKDYGEQTSYFVLGLFALLGIPVVLIFAAWPLFFALAADLVLLPFQLIARAKRAKQEAAEAAKKKAEAIRRERERREAEARKPKPPTRAGGCGRDAGAVPATSPGDRRGSSP